ncbi:MAG: hypothetical protein PHV34_19155 [Verrucomicrobiae bacterium]|nr:hypothetical protein [Verrucomicrobiae bacterium]
MKIYLVAFAILLYAIVPHSSAQVPVTVNKSTVLSGGTIMLPTIVGAGTANVPTGYVMDIGGGGCTGDTSGNTWLTVGGSASLTITGVSGTARSYIVYGYPQVTIKTTAPSAFTNSVTALVNVNIHVPGGSDGWSQIGAGQSYAVTIVDDTGGGGGSGSTSKPYATLTGMGDAMESLSRRNASDEARKLLGFMLKSTTNAVVSAIGVGLSNTTTNSVENNNFSSVKLYSDDGSGDWSGADSLLSTTTNTSGMAVFNSLNISTDTTNKTFFVVANFCPTNQTKNSFITAVLRGQNISATVTNVAIEVTGGTVVGKQWAFMDTTQAEDDAYAYSLTNGLVNASITNGLANASITNGLVNASITNGLVTASITNGLGGTTVYTTTTSTSTKTGFSLSDTILPAVAAGTAGIGAAFTSDQMTSQPLSKEYSKPVNQPFSKDYGKPANQPLSKDYNKPQ